jgi:phage tail sheath protein FI
VSIINAVKPEVKINDQEQRTLNVDPLGGKSVNVVRSFTGRGSAIVWGARTLAGNDNEWRYISVRRFFIMVEQSVKNATEQFVFEPNDENTWVRIKSMIENYLTEQWKAGALMGTSTKEAYYVHVGLNQTMTEVDIWEGRLIIEIGLAAVRPAEFIILRFMHKMLSET